MTSPLEYDFIIIIIIIIEPIEITLKYCSESEAASTLLMRPAGRLGLAALHTTAVTVLAAARNRLVSNADGVSLLHRHYSVSQKSSPLKLSAIFSLVVNV